MRRANVRNEQAGRDRWMVSYTDVMTILLILFVAVAARAVQQSAPPPPPARKDPASEALLRTKGALASRGIPSTIEARGLVISLPQTVLYPSG
jgi:flagellar motor protein MotB